MLSHYISIPLTIHIPYKLGIIRNLKILVDPSHVDYHMFYYVIDKINITKELTLINLNY